MTDPWHNYTFDEVITYYNNDDKTVKEIRVMDILNSAMEKLSKDEHERKQADQMHALIEWLHVKLM